jgi:hypothetical protein
VNRLTRVGNGLFGVTPAGQGICQSISGRLHVPSVKVDHDRWIIVSQIRRAELGQLTELAYGKAVVR